MSKNYLGFAVSDSMFDGDVVAIRHSISDRELAEFVEEHPDIVVIANPSHRATFKVVSEQFGINLEIPPTPVKVNLKSGDNLFIIQVKGLPRLVDRHEYTPEEISKAKFAFSQWTFNTSD